MYHIPRLSEVVYVGLCRKVGSPTEVRMRKEVMDTEEVTKKPVYIMRGLVRVRSGSRREGFRLNTSDIDCMLWPPNHKVICHLSQISLYRISKDTVILMECDDLPMGFTRLILMNPSNYAEISYSCVVMNNKVYISSILFRDNCLQSLKTSDPHMTCAFPHGPSSSFSILPGSEADFVYCFWSQHWPTLALPWIQRCSKQGWPVENVVSDIVSGGFHVVPIGSTPDNGLEWRISFSLAEQKLIYSMNHCQFLCYGLFKIFLKEVINCQTNPPLLCSYFIKTTVFWVIQNNTSLIWAPDYLLLCFWESFKLMICWVRTGVCPNFFIPQNNMFRLKLVSSAQTALYRQLNDLYCKGISCLLLSETIRPYLSQAILNRTLRVCTDESSLISSTGLESCLLSEVALIDQDIRSVEEFAVYMKQLERMACLLGLTPYQTVTLQFMTAIVLRISAMFLDSCKYLNENSNKVCYRGNKVSALLKQSCKFGWLSDILYLAMYLYRTRRYEDSLRCLHIAQKRMSLPYIRYEYHVNVDVCRRCMGGVSLDTKLRRAVVRDIELLMVYTYIDELVLERDVCEKNINPLFKIPPLVMLHMLLFLNHHRLGDIVRTQRSLRDLQNLLLYDAGFYIPRHLRDISWQILGICQQIYGDYSGSLQSYRYSLQQEPFHKLQRATLIRIITLIYKVSQS